MPDPAPGGTGAELWELLNVADEDRALLWAWMVSVIAYPDIPHPIVVFSGEQGTGKSTAARLLVRLLDPSTPELHAPPGNAALWESTATGSYVVALDNLSTIKRDISDLLCRAVTGEGFVKRELYTDGDHAIAEFRSALILTGIDLGGVPNDLAERLLTVELEPVTQRRAEADLNAEFDRARPRLFGALLDAAARVRAVDALHIELPRMADFAQVVAKLDHLHGGDALARYAEKDTVQAAAALAADPFTAHLIEHLKHRFEGKAGQLREELQLGTFWNPIWWPRTAAKMAAELKRAATSLRKLGWIVERHYDPRVKTFNWVIAPHPPQVLPVAGVEPPQPRQPPQTITPSQPPVTAVAGVAGGGVENPGASVPDCRTCGQLLDPVIVADGYRTHPTCSTEGISA
jgi:DNA polymerase III delta prime subunit